MKSIAIITARGGSKRIPRKNIRDFCGKPIIAYSIETALESKLFDEVMVSTDDEEIAEISKKFGATVPFFRSKENSDDYSGTSDVLIEVLNQYNDLNLNFDYCCCIYPTAPFVTVERLKQGFEKIQSNHFDCVFPVVKFSFPILRSLKMESSGRISPNWSEYIPKRSQDLPSAYHDSGQYYWFSVNSFLKNKSLITDNTGGIEIPDLEVQDIDTEDDWKMAEFKFQFLKKGIR